jgi:hypothetical protein
MGIINRRPKIESVEPFISSQEVQLKALENEEERWGWLAEGTSTDQISTSRIMDGVKDVRRRREALLNDDPESYLQ